MVLKEKWENSVIKEQLVPKGALEEKVIMEGKDLEECQESKVDKDLRELPEISV